MQLDVKELKATSKNFLPKKDFAKLELMLDRIEKKASRYSIDYPAFSRLSNLAQNNQKEGFQTLRLLNLIASKFPNLSSLRYNILTPVEHGLMGSTPPIQSWVTTDPDVPIAILTSALGASEVALYRNKFFVEATTSQEKLGFKKGDGKSLIYFILQPFDINVNKVLGEPLPIDITKLNYMIRNTPVEKFETISINEIAKLCAISEKDV